MRKISQESEQKFSFGTRIQFNFVLRMRIMKFFLLFVLVLGVSADTSAVHDEARLQGFGGGIADLINVIIKKLLESMRGVIPDPINMAKMNISLPYAMANGSFIISDLVEIGAKNFNASTVQADILKSSLNVVLDFPSININTNYFADILLGSILPMYGQGPANIRLKNLRFNLTSKYTLKIFSQSMQIKNTTLLISLGDAVFDIHGMINNEAFSIVCSQILDDTINVFINKHNVLISKILSPVIETVVNKALSPKKKVQDAMVFKNVPLHFEEAEIMELRQVFMSELLKHPLISKLVSF